MKEHCEDSRADENKDIDAAKEADKEADTNLEEMWLIRKSKNYIVSWERGREAEEGDH